MASDLGPAKFAVSPGQYLSIDAATSKAKMALASCSVSGSVVHSNRQPAVAFQVQAYKSTLSAESAVSPAVLTDASGRYRLAVDLSSWPQPHSLFVKVFRPAGGTQCVRSEIRISVMFPATIDVTVSD
ncbi:MAG: hypothetical protein ACHQQ3_14605 [Gemmatimonadales bacterium]